MRDEVLESYAERAAQSQPLPTLDFKIHKEVLLHLQDVVRWLSWPQDLYIPAAADAKNYWITACPPDHRYTHGWAGGPGSGANHANPSDGHLFAFAAARPSDTMLHSEAGIGFYFTPGAKLAVYTIQPAVAAIAQYRWDTGIARDWGGTIRLQGFFYTAAWEVSAYDGSLSLVTPYGFAPVFDQSFNNQGGIPITSVTPPWPPGPPATNVMLQGGRTYLISGIAAVQIDNGWTDAQGHPLTSFPPEGIWKVWCSVDGVVSSVSVEPSTIYIP